MCFQATHVGTLQCEDFKFPREGANAALLSITCVQLRLPPDFTSELWNRSGLAELSECFKLSGALSSECANVKLTLKTCVFKHVNQSKACRNATKYQRRIRLCKCSLRVYFLTETEFSCCLFFCFSTALKVFYQAKRWWLIALIYHSLRDAASLTFPIHSWADFFTELTDA